MKNELKVFIVFLIFSNANLFSQLSGVVYDSKSNLPLYGVNILIPELKRGCFSNDNGAFEFRDLKNGKYSLIFSYVGYQKDSLIVDYDFNLKKEIKLALRQSFLKLNDIVITSTRTGSYLKNSPISTQIINSNELNEIGASNVSEALEWVAGMSVGQSRLGTDLEIQGIGAKRVLVLVDGVKMVGKLNDVFDLSQIPASSVKRIEIVKGGGSTLYGSEAMGGVINIITKDPKDFFNFSARSDFGAFGRFNSNIDVSIPLGEWKSSYTFSYRRSDGFDLDPSTIFREGPEYDKYDGMIKITGSIGSLGNIEIGSGYFNESQYLISSQVMKDLTYNDRKSISLRHTKNFDENNNLNFNFEYVDAYHRMDQQNLLSKYILRGGETINKLLKGELLFNSSSALHNILLGYGFEKENIESDRIINNKNFSYLHNIFAQDQYQLLPFVNLTYGLRYDYHSIYGGQLSPKISMMHNPFTNFRVRLNYGSGFRAPSFKELYFNFDNSGTGYRILGNPDLKPESSNSLNLNLEYWSKDDWSINLNTYFNKIKDLIDYNISEQIGGISIWSLSNIENVRTWGGEIEFKIKLSDYFEQMINYSYLDTYNEATKEPLSYRSKHKGNLVTHLHYSIFDFQIRQHIYTEQKLYGDDIVVNSDKTITTNIAGRYILSFHTNINFPNPYNIILTGGVKNITDQFDKDFGPMPGREWYIGIQYDFKK